MKKKQNGIICVTSWPEKWMRKAYTLTWSVLVLLSLALIAALYLKVVYTLWFKRDDDGQHTHQLMVKSTFKINKEKGEIKLIFRLI